MWSESGSPHPLWSLLLSIWGPGWASEGPPGDCLIQELALGLLSQVDKCPASFSCWDWVQNWRDFVGCEFQPDPAESMVSLAPSPFCSVPIEPTYKGGSPQWPLTMPPLAFFLELPFVGNPSWASGLEGIGDCISVIQKGLCKA